MMRYIESDATDPSFNLALEQHVFDSLDATHDYFMLWRNDNAVIVGKHQNTAAEINAERVKEYGVRVVRRLSGGGAVYHDLGNVNFTFIAGNAKLGAFDFASFCRPVVRALASLGVTAEINGRNDMTIDGKKFSGNAQYRKRGRVMHHGTLLYDSDLSMLGKILNAAKDKIESKGLRSVRGRVTNIKSHMQADLSVTGFMEALKESMFREFDLVPYALAPRDEDAVNALREERYSDWDWNYGASPPYTVRKKRRIEGCGAIETFIDVERGIIRNIAFRGDYFGAEDARALAEALKGRRLERSGLETALSNVDVGACIHNLDRQTLIEILTG